MNLAVAISIVGVLAVASYFLVNATSNTSSSCTGGLLDYVNPFCIIGSIVDNAENELNTVVIIILLAVIALVALILFSPNTVGILGSFRL
jgi:hypothetical protein